MRTIPIAMNLEAIFNSSETFGICSFDLGRRIYTKEELLELRKGRSFNPLFNTDKVARGDFRDMRYTLISNEEVILSGVATMDDTYSAGNLTLCAGILPFFFPLASVFFSAHDEASIKFGPGEVSPGMKYEWKILLRMENLTNIFSFSHIQARAPEPLSAEDENCLPLPLNTGRNMFFTQSNTVLNTPQTVITSLDQQWGFQLGKPFNPQSDTLLISGDK